jgi:hypothetical protein
MAYIPGVPGARLIQALLLSTLFSQRPILRLNNICQETGLSGNEFVRNEFVRNEFVRIEFVNSRWYELGLGSEMLYVELDVYMAQKILSSWL